MKADASTVPTIDPTHETVLDAGPRPTLLTPARVLFGWRPVMLAGVFLAVTLAALAAYDRGSVLLTWDEPVQRWVEGARTAAWDDFFRGASRLGSNVVIFAGVAVLALVLAWRRHYPLALAVLGAGAFRPAYEFVMKALIDRPRPDIGRLVPGNGPSHPSGHVLASLALWGLLPAVVLVLTGRRTLARAALVVVTALIVCIAASRVYLGVHWLSDVVGGFVVGSLYLLAVEWLLMSWLDRHPSWVLPHLHGRAA